MTTSLTSISYTEATQTTSEQITIITGYFVMLNTNQGNCFWDSNYGWMCGGYSGSAANLAVQGHAACDHLEWLTYVKMIPPDLIISYTTGYEAGGTKVFYLHYLDGHTDTYRGGCSGVTGQSVITVQSNFMGKQTIPLTYIATQTSLNTVKMSSSNILPLYSNLGFSDTAFGSLAVLVIGALALIALVYGSKRSAER